MLITGISVFYYIRILKLIFFEVEITKKINQLFQGNFLFLYQDISLTLLCFIAMILLLFFFSPTFFILISKYISIGFFKL